MLRPCLRQMRAFPRKVTMDTYAGRQLFSGRTQGIACCTVSPAWLVTRFGFRERLAGCQPRALWVPIPCEAGGMATFRAEQFSVRVSDEVLADLRARIANTRWPGPGPGAPWEQGTDLGYLRDLLAYWGGRLRLARAGTLAERVRSLPGRDRWCPGAFCARTGPRRPRNPADLDKWLAELLRRVPAARALADGPGRAWH